MNDNGSSQTGIRTMMFRSYIYGYLNTYYNLMKLTNTDEHEYKREKFARAASYLKLHGRKRTVFIVLCGLLAYIENAVYVISITITLFRFIFNKVFHQNVYHVNSEKDIIVYGYGSWNLISLIQKAGLNNDDLVFLTYPFRDNRAYQNYKNVNVAAELDLKEILRSYWYAIRMIFFIKRKYGYRDVLFHTNNAMEFFLIGFYYLKHADYKVCFVDLYDRWANMFGSLKNYKILIQHGYIYQNFHAVKKVGSANVAYVFNETQKRILLECLFYKFVDSKQLSIMQFSANEKLIENNKKNLLIICNHLFFEKEKYVVEILSHSNKWNIYIKPHPLDDQTHYERLVSQYQVIMLGKRDFPKVDIAISYASTLALEYQMAGVHVIQYNDSDFEFELKRLV